MQGEFHKTALWRRAAVFGVQRGPRWFVAIAPPCIGWTMAMVLPKARRAVRRNLRLVVGRRGFWAETRDVFRTFASFARSLVDGMQANERVRAVRVHGAEGLTQLVTQGSGLVLLTAHAGPYDRAAQLVAEELGVSVLLLMGREEDQAAAAVQDSIRDAFHVRVVRLGGHPLDALPALEHLGKGGLVAAQVDRLPNDGAPIVSTLFGAPFLVPRGPFALAGLAGVPIASVFVAHRADGDYQLVTGAPITLGRRPSEAEFQTSARAVLSLFEDYLKAFPTQWYHFAPLRTEEARPELEKRGAARNHLAKGAP